MQEEVNNCRQLKSARGPLEGEVCEVEEEIARRRDERGKHKRIAKRWRFFN